MRHLYTQIDIAAPVERVWQVLTDLDGYSNWNPFIVQARALGKLQAGTTLNVRFRPPNCRETVFAPKVVRYDPPQRFSWRGKMFAGALLNGEHGFYLRAFAPARVCLIHEECFRGLLVPFVWKHFLDTKLREGFEQFNRSLKTVAEGGGILKGGLSSD